MKIYLSRKKLARKMVEDSAIYGESFAIKIWRFYLYVSPLQVERYINS
jgi:hypothetical protein